MFAPGGTLQLKRSLNKHVPLVLVRVEHIVGRIVHTDKGPFHYSELEVPPKTMIAPIQKPVNAAFGAAIREHPLRRARKEKSR